MALRVGGLGARDSVTQDYRYLCTLLFIHI
jgi:hypothetical protein